MIPGGLYETIYVLGCLAGGTNELNEVNGIEPVSKEFGEDEKNK